MLSQPTFRHAALSIVLLFSFAAPPGLAKLTLPAETPAVLAKIYSFDLAGAVEAAKRMEQEYPDHPLGYLLESEALWWRIWCASAEFKYGMTDARRRAKSGVDHRYLELVAKVSSLAEAQAKQHESAELQFYAGMADAAGARFYALRGENRNAARSGVRARDHFIRSRTLDPSLADADMGLGLYNYYVDTLSAMARLLRFFMGIPGGSKQEGVRLLERAIADGVLVRNVARFYLALNLHRYDLQYEKALGVIGPLAEQYPGNPLFLLARGDLYAKLGRKDQALASYRAAAALAVPDADCQVRIRELARLSVEALGATKGH